MSRSPRAFKPVSFELEPRFLLRAMPLLPLPDPRPVLDFVNVQRPAAGTGAAVQHFPTIALQQDGSATVLVSYNPGQMPPTPLQVIVATDPSSPAVGVNVGAVRQTITLDAAHNFSGRVTVPILPGAPNPGHVDVALTLTPIDPPPGLQGGDPMTLRILASRDELVPRILRAEGKPQGIVVTFNKPMNPAGASNVKNYAVSKAWTGGSNGYSLFGNSTPGGSAATRFRSAQYDPETLTVTLVPKRKFRYAGYISLSVGNPAQGPRWRAYRADPGPPLTDMRGTPIAADTPTPGVTGIAVLHGVWAEHGPLIGEPTGVPPTTL